MKFRFSHQEVGGLLGVIVMVVMSLIGRDVFGMSPADVLNAKGFALLKEVCDTNENVMISPFSIYACLGQVWLAAEGETASELERALGFDRESKLLIGRAIESWKGVRDATIRTANSLWLSPHTEVNNSYYAAVGKTFGSKFHSADFSCPQKAAMEINRFVSDATNGKIGHAVDSSDFVGNMRAVIVNALYFFSKWEDPFSCEDTRQEEFKRPKTLGGVLGGAKKVRMMHGIRKVPYAEWDGAQAIALPYRSSQFEFMVVLPQKDHSPLEILKKLSETGLEPLRQTMSQAEVKISLPKVSMRSSFKLKDVLVRMGVSRLFEPSRSEIVYIRDSNGPVYVHEVSHVTCLDVDEEGTEAAAATAAYCLSKCVRRPLERKLFVADHPYVAIVYDKVNELALFVAVVNDP